MVAYSGASALNAHTWVNGAGTFSHCHEAFLLCSIIKIFTGTNFPVWIDWRYRSLGTCIYCSQTALKEDLGPYWLQHKQADSHGIIFSLPSCILSLVMTTKSWNAMKGSHFPPTKLSHFSEFWNSATGPVFWGLKWGRRLLSLAQLGVASRPSVVFVLGQVGVKMH